MREGAPGLVAEAGRRPACSGPGGTHAAAPAHRVFMTLTSVTSPLAEKCSRNLFSSAYLGMFLTHSRELVATDCSSMRANAAFSPAGAGNHKRSSKSCTQVAAS